MIKNEEDNDEKKTIVGANQIKAEKLRKIEKQASQNFENYSDRRQSAQSKLPYYLTNLLKIKLAKLERTKTISLGEMPKSKRRLNFDLIKPEITGVNVNVISRPHSVASSPKKGVRSSSFVRKIDFKYTSNEENSLK